MRASSASSSSSGSGYDSPGIGYDSSSEESQSSADEEISRRSPKRKREQDDGDEDVIFREAVFEELGQQYSRSGRTVKAKKKHKSDTLRLSPTYQSEGTVTATDSDSDVVRKHSRRRHLKYPSSEVSGVSEDELDSNYDEDDIEQNDFSAAAEVNKAIFEAEEKEKPGVPRQLKTFQNAEPGDMLPLTANFFCCGCKKVKYGFIVDGEVRDRSYKEVEAILESLRTKYNIRLTNEQR